MSLEGELSALLRKVNDAHPDVLQLRSRIAESRRRVEQLRQQVLANDGLSASSTRSCKRRIARPSHRHVVHHAAGRDGCGRHFARRRRKALIALLTAVTGSGK